jgi:hypothetical protein
MGFLAIPDHLIFDGSYMVYSPEEFREFLQHHVDIDESFFSSELKEIAIETLEKRRGERAELATWKVEDLVFSPSIHFECVKNRKVYSHQFGLTPMVTIDKAKQALADSLVGIRPFHNNPITPSSPVKIRKLYFNVFFCSIK